MSDGCLMVSSVRRAASSLSVSVSLPLALCSLLVLARMLAVPSLFHVACCCNTLLLLLMLHMLLLLLLPPPVSLLADVEATASAG